LFASSEKLPGLPLVISRLAEDARPPDSTLLTV